MNEIQRNWKAISIATVKNRLNEFQVSWKRLSRSTTWQKFTIFISRLKVREIAEIIGISNGGSEKDIDAMRATFSHCEYFGTIRWGIAEKNDHICEGNSALPPWRRTGSHLCRRQSQIGRIKLRTHPPYFVFNLEKVVLRKEIRLQCGGCRRRGGLICRRQDNIKQVRVLLG